MATDIEPGMEAVLQLARQCGQQQRLLKMNSTRQEELLGELEGMLVTVNERVTAFASSWDVNSCEVRPDSANDSSSTTQNPKLKRGNSAVGSIASSKADLSSEREAMINAKKALNGMSGQIYDTIYTPSLYTRKTAQKAKNPLLRGALHFVGDLLFKFETLKEPPRTGCLASLVFSRWFQMLSVSVILVNSVSIALSADYEISNLGQEATVAQQNMELALALFYVLELILKLSVNRLYFFVNEDALWNCFDFCLVLFSIIEYAVMLHLEFSNADEGTGGGMNVGFLRMFRLCKIAKVLRVFRTLRFFTELRLMMDCVLGSFINVFWCLAMIVFVLYVFSLLIVQGLTEYLVSVEHLDEVYKTKYMKFFGSVGNATITLFQATTAGIDWSEAFDVLRVSGVFPSLCFLTYVIIFTISVWNIVTSTFVEKAMKLAQPDLESMIHEKNIKDAKDAGDLSRLFLPFTSKNEEGEDVISFEQIRAAAEQPRFRQDLTVRGVDIKNVEIFFKMLSAVNEGGVNLQTLVSACVRMKGVATSIDLQSVSFEIQLISSVMEKKFKEQDIYLQSIEKLLMHRGDLITSSPGWNVDEPMSDPEVSVEMGHEGFPTTTGSLKEGQFNI
eukprot:symbB.v1.2.020368.t1/scaffold1709.1/size105151/2